MKFNQFYFLTCPVLVSFAFFVSSSSVLEKENSTNYINLSSQQQKTELQKSINRGKDIYADFCIQCHLANGKGDKLNFPPLDGSDWLIKKRKQSIHAVKYGQTGPIVVNGKKYNNTMPEMGLENQEVADVMNYIMNSWSNKQTKIVTLEEVKSIPKD
ncbi:cytochrome c [Flavobacterium sp. NG2]|uniref:c-type cytochrome n=1 Tax=Flavobacterium sp. NG2 TaxID=3097547 RepID=UPI002A83796C|nr:cytochrome c [Flavobacterium sp. NG2]WPR72430.1 cytochrome c [Flavobacterium sp. NG2]